MTTMSIRGTSSFVAVIGKRHDEAPGHVVGAIRAFLTAEMSEVIVGRVAS